MSGVTGTGVRGARVPGDVQHPGRGGGTAASAPRIRAAGIVLLVAHLAFAGWLALRPLAVPWVAPANLMPLATISPALHDGSPGALRPLVESLMLLAPLGVLMPLAGNRLHRPLAGTFARTVSGGALISCLLLLLQSGAPGHTVNVDSVLLNTAGVAMAALLVYPVVRAVLRSRAGAAGGPHGGGRGALPAYGPLPRREETRQGAAPRTAGVGIAP